MKRLTDTREMNRETEDLERIAKAQAIALGIPYQEVLESITVEKKIKDIMHETYEKLLSVMEANIKHKPISLFCAALGHLVECAPQPSRMKSILFLLKIESGAFKKDIQNIQDVMDKDL